MKKIVLSFAALAATMAAVPEASALPLFSRQVGMACSACHFQHFPLLNSFGRDFKASGYTLTGNQVNLKDEHLSLPTTLNMSVLANARYDGVSHPPGVPMPPKWQIPGSAGELIVSFGGRIADFAGFLGELTALGPVAVGAVKMPMLFQVGDFRVGPVVMTTADQGIAYSFELMNTGAAIQQTVTPYVGGAFSGSTGTALNHAAVASAAQFLGTSTPATGYALVAAKPNLGYVSVAKYDATLPGAPIGPLPFTYVRVAGLFGLGAWDAGVGIQNWSGSSPVALIDHRATVIDAQLQGELAGLPLGVYASYGRAPAVMATPFTVGNAFNMLVPTATTAATTFNIAAELGILPRVAVLMALRSAKVGGDPVGGITGVTSNGALIGASYELAQNVELSLTHTLNFGSAWAGNATAAYGLAPLGRNETSLSLDALF
ncbi:MAG TPA: hypothetical protein VFK88_06005 [Gallionella sp.]|nr:hypothetical protein [Gallionella sp.]